MDIFQTCPFCLWSFLHSLSFFPLYKKTLLISSISLLLPVSLQLCIHLLNRASRQADLFTGVHSVLKVFEHHWMLGRNRAHRSGYMIPSLLLCDSPETNTHAVTWETMESFNLLTSLHLDLKSLCGSNGLAISQHLFHTASDCWENISKK